MNYYYFLPSVLLYCSGDWCSRRPFKSLLLFFGCASEEFRVIVADMSNYMSNSSPPWYSYRNMMACPLVALDKRPGVLPIGIGETLQRYIANLVMRAEGDQARTVCGSLQMCAGLEAGIEELTHAVA